MDISFLGAGCARLSGRQTSVVCDPYDESAGLGKLKVTADIVLLTDVDYTTNLSAKLVIDGPGEYEIADTLVTGVAAQRHIDADGQKATAYAIDIDDFRVVFIGNVAPTLNNEQLEALSQPDVLIVPVGGHGLTLDAQAAAELVSQLEPKFVIPVHFDDGQTKYAMPQDGLDKFLKEMGASPEPQPKLKLTTKELPPETMVVVLNKV